MTTAYVADPTSIWEQAVPADASLEQRSPRFVSTLRSMVAADVAAARGPWIDAQRCAPPVYVVGADVPPTSVNLLYGSRPGRLSLQEALSSVPIPANARPSNCRDATMVIEQPSTNKMWELWHARRDASGAWWADWGGATNRMSTNDGVFGIADWTGAQPYWGASASSMMLTGGALTYTELEAGYVDHALALSVPQAAARIWSSPAERTDGVSTAVGALPYGGRFRLDPTLDVESLRVPEVTKVLARAAQRYGIFVREQTHYNVQFSAIAAPAGDPDVYTRIFGGLPGPIMRAFPWSRLQLLELNLQGDGARIAAVTG